MNWTIKRLATLSFLVLLSATLAAAPPSKAQPLRIGTSGGLRPAAAWPKEKLELEALRGFIKEETGMENAVTRESDWQALVSELEAGKLQLGVFAGHEFAWAEEKFTKLKALAVAVNGQRYPVVYVVARKDSKASDIKSLQGQSMSVSATGEPTVRLYLEREAQAAGKQVKEYFSDLATADSAESALDDVIDGKVQAAALEQSAWEAYKRRKPGRFAQLKEVAQSRSFPPIVVAYVEGSLDDKTLERFRSGLVGASSKERGKMLLTMLRLKGFEKVPGDFERVLADTAKAYPPDEIRR